MRKGDIEKSLKRFLKRKVSYSLSLLIAFMITGGLSFGAGITAEEIQETKGDLLTKIQTEREEIKRKIAENEKLIGEYNSDFVELVRKGDFYSKPLFNSTQVFLSYQYLDSGKMKDRTDKEFKETIDAINKHYGTRSGRSLLRSSGNVGKDKIMSGNGVGVDTEIFREEIEVGANIVPIEPILPEIEKTINVIVGVPTIGGIPSLTAPIVTAPTAPGAITSPTISVTTPGAIASINVTAPSIPTPTVPGDKTIVKPTVTIPNAVDPTMVNAPEKPTAPEILIPDIPDVAFSSLSIGNGNKIYADHSTGQNGFISNIAVLNGKFYVDRDNREKVGISSKIITYGGFDYRYTDYVAYGYIGAASAGETLGNNAITTLNAPTNKQFYNSGSTNSYYLNYGTGVQAVTVTYIGLYNNGDFVYSGRNERSDLNLREFVHMDNHGATNTFTAIRNALVKATDRTNVTIAQYVTAAKAANVINAWDDAAAVSKTVGATYTGTHGGAYSERGMMWLNSGKIVMEGGNLSLTNQYMHGGSTNTVTFAINTDEVIVRPFFDGTTMYDAYNSGFLISTDNNGTNQQVMYNSGSMKFYTNDSGAYTINSGGGSILNNVVINRGTIEMSGKGSLGIYAKSAASTSGTLYMDFTDGAGTRKPVVLYGDESIGLYVTDAFKPSGNNISGNFHADIGDSLGTANKVLNVAAGDTNGGSAINNYYGDNSNTDKIEGTVGILSYKSMTLDSHGIKIYSNTENSIGVVPITTTTGTSPMLTLGTGSVEVLGGESNIGMIAMNIYAADGVTLKNKGGSISSSSTIVLDGGKNNVGAVAKNGYSISIKDIKGNGNTSVNGIGLYADGASITTTGGISNLKLSVDSPTSSDNINALGAFAANGAAITVNKTVLSSTPDIEIQGAEVSGSAGSYRGIGLMVDGGTINAQYTNIKVTDGAAGVASIGASGNIDISNGKIEVNNGYAAYTDGIGKINLTNTEIILGGTATAFDIDKDTMAPVTLTLTGTKVHVKSNDVIVFNIKNLPATSISALQAAVTSGVAVTSDAGIIEYLEAALEKTTINVDIAMDKSSKTGADFYYFNRVVAQNSILNVNSPVTANLASVSTASALGADAYKGQVIGLEMNSSKSATSNATTKINNTSTISAARTDAGAGAVGVFINYGQLDNTGTIEVQKGYTGVNGGTGVFATNGSKVDNKLGATIDAYGEEALGIYATAWRKTSLGTLAGEEFGATALNQGETSIINSGDIVTNGDKSVGIYLENNSRDASLAIGMDRTISAANAGTITVGKDSIGMYASGTGTGYESETEVGNTGTIKVGENSTGIYGENAVTVTSIGNFELGKGATGIALSPDSKIDPAATFGTITTTGGVSDRVLLAIHGNTSSPAATSIAMPGGTLDTSSISNMTSLYVQGATGASTDTTTILKIGASGVGIYVNTGTAANTGKIELASGKTNAVGMYTKKGTISNTGTIEVGDSTQLGMVGVSTDAILTNTGIIDLKGTGAAGIVVQNGATITDSGASNIAFSSTKSFGIAADNANVVLNGGNVSIANTGENIYVYAKNNSNTTINGALTIDGIAANPTKKSVGIYLDGTNTLTNNSTLTAVNGSIGVYANGANSLTNGTYNSTGDSTVGIYFTNGGTLANTTVNSGSLTGNSVGVYTAGGQVNISGGLTLNIGTSMNTGTGMYFANGASAAGDTITVANNSTTSSNIGLYYTGTGSTTHGANLILGGANREVGIFVDGGLNLTNTSNITDSTATGSVGVLVGGGSTYRGTGVFTVNTVGTSIGYFVNNGTAENGNSIDITGAGTASVGMVASASSGTATAINTGTITTSSNVGMAVLTGTGTSTGINTGTINTATGTGVYVKGANAGFNGAGGTINVTGTGTGIVLDATGAGKVTNAGTINLAANSVGVYAENASTVDFPLTVRGTSGTGVYAKSGSIVSGTINAADSVDTVAVYLEDATAGINGATVTTGNSSVTTSIGVFLGGTAQTYALSNNNINVNSSGTIGVLADNGNTINYSSTTNVGTGAIGLYLKGAGTTLNANAGTINITGTGIGVLVDTGATANLGTAGTLTVNFNGGGGILSFNNGGTVNLGANITIGSGTGTLAATKDGNLSNSGTITIGNGSAGLLGVYSAGGPYTVSNTGTGVINVQAGGLGLVATGSGAAVTVKNDNIINVTGQDAVGMYADVGNIDNALGTINVTNNGIGMYLAGTGSILNFGILNVTKGVGYVVNGATLGGATGTVTLHAGDADNYSIGGYYFNTSGIINLPTITDADYSIKAAINGGTNTVTGAITASGGQNKIGIFASNSTTTLGTVTANGKGNIGVYGTNSNLDISGIGVTNSTLTAAEDMSVGVVLNGGSYNGSGNVSVGDNGIGLYATGIQGGNNIVHNGGTLQVGNSALGFYGEGSGAGTENLTVNTTGITIGTKNAVGIYVKNMNTDVTGNMTIGKGSSVGIASIGDGNIDYTGSITINDKADQAASVGIYKSAGTGTITTLAGNWTVGAGGYGIYVQQGTSGKAAVINNSADMTLGMSSVGIFSNGANTVNNSGNITVGATDVKGDHNNVQGHLNSIGMYISGRTTAINSGTITVNHDHSVGVYASGTGTSFTNTGTINIDSGGVGIIVRDGAEAINALGANINLGGTPPPIGCNAVTVGMSAGMGSKIINNGTITVNEGAGMLVVTGATFENTGTIVVNNGVGIEGIGSTVNAGHIIVNGGVAVGAGGLATAQVGAVEIKPDGTIKINGNYTSIGGTLSTAGNIIVDGAYVDVTTGTPLFNANSVSGEVRILPNFATTGNGISYEMEGFVNTAMGTITGTKLTPVTSPLFIAKVTDKGSLVIAKRPYADLVIGEQFDALHKGLDNILKNSGGTGRDADILKGLNEYLEGLPADQFERETSLKLAETRGDIYATIQGRMQDINQAFDNSFYELESSYNMTKDSSKYSVIYTDGKYRDSTLGIDDYDYKVMGLLYMKEKEGTEYGSKYGYTIGFAGSKFDFDDGGSKEDVYSLRVGAHRVKNLSEEHKVSWLSRIELGYNRHIAKRKLNLQENYENKGEYNTYSVAFDNRLTKVIYTDLSRQLDVYADLDLEYGKIDDFKESAGSKGGLEVQIKDNDYLSAQAGAGVKASQRIYAGNDISVKVTADVKYAYEFGDNYDGNKARLKNGEEGYYSLITPEEREGKLTGKVGLTIEKANHMGVTFEVEAADEKHKKDSSIKYGVRFNYKF